MQKVVRAFFLSCFIALIMGFAAYPITEFLNTSLFHVKSFATNYNFFTLGVVTGFVSSFAAFVVQIITDYLQERSVKKSSKV